jgi:hypothetical protein
MARFKAARGKTKSRAPRQGVGCIIMLVLFMLLGILFLVYVMGHASQS